jgi:hypothetical protein
LAEEETGQVVTKRKLLSAASIALFGAVMAASDFIRAEAGGGAPGHGHGDKVKDDHGKEKKKGGHGGMPMSGGRMKMGGSMEKGGHEEPAAKGLSKIQARGSKLISDLHCNACHFVAKEMAHGAGHGGGHGGVAPDLSFLGG